MFRIILIAQYFLSTIVFDIESIILIKLYNNVDHHEKLCTRVWNVTSGHHFHGNSKNAKKDVPNLSNIVEMVFVIQSIFGIFKMAAIAVKTRHEFIIKPNGKIH